MKCLAKFYCPPTFDYSEEKETVIVKSIHSSPNSESNVSRVTNTIGIMCSAEEIRR